MATSKGRELIATGPAADVAWVLTDVCKSGSWYSVRISDGMYEIATAPSDEIIETDRWGL